MAPGNEFEIGDSVCRKDEVRRACTNTGNADTYKIKARTLQMKGDTLIWLYDLGHTTVTESSLVAAEDVTSYGIEFLITCLQQWVKR